MIQPQAAFARGCQPGAKGSHGPQGIGPTLRLTVAQMSLATEPARTLSQTAPVTTVAVKGRMNADQSPRRRRRAQDDQSGGPR